jgi:hypothetical protein
VFSLEVIGFGDVFEIKEVCVSLKGLNVGSEESEVSDMVNVFVSVFVCSLIGREVIKWIG